MINLVSLEFKGIGRFIDYQKIDFSNKGKLLQINGKRLDYGGSSGAGKSTIIHINDLILGLKTKPLTTLQSRKSKDGYWVRGTYECGPNKSIISIERSKKDGLIIEGFCPFTSQPIKISENNQIAEEYLDRIIEIPRDIFKKMVHKEQKEGGFILNMPPSDMFKFLAKILGLDSWLEKLTKLDSYISEKEKSLDVLKNTEQSRKDLLDSALAAYEKYNESAEVYPLPVNLFDSLRFSELSAAHEAALSAKTQALGLIKIPVLMPLQVIDMKSSIDKTHDINLKFQSLDNKTRIAIGDHNQRIKNFEAMKIEHGKVEIKKSEIKNSIIEKRNAIKHIDENSCPTCSQIWNNGDSERAKETLNGEISALAQLFKKILEEQPKLEDIGNGIVEARSEIKKLEQLLITEEKNKNTKLNLISADLEIEKSRIRDLNAEIVAKNNSLGEAYKKEIEKTSKIFDEQLSMLKNEMDSLKTAELTYKRDLDFYNEKMTFVKKSKEVVQVNYDKELISFQKHQSDTTAVTKCLEIANESKRVVKSFLFKAFDEALDHIGKVATDSLSKVPNASTCTVYFEPFKEVKGKIKEEVVCYISIDGDEGVPVKSLSGGERSSIDLAIDLAASEFIQQKSGMGADFLFLDEPFEGLESQTRVEYVELLKVVSGNKRIILVEHTDQVKEMVEDTITVVRDTDRSYIDGV